MLAMDGADVVGGTGEGAVFRLSVDAGGNVTLTQYAQIDHLPESLDSSNDNASVSLASGVITLSATATVTDFDHDEASGTLTADLGGNISFDDDIPSVNVAVVVDGGIHADDTGRADHRCGARHGHGELRSRLPRRR